MNLNLDLSGLSPTVRDELWDEMTHILLKHEFCIHSDVAHYGEGPAKDQMLGWEKACRQVYDSILDQKQAWGRT